MRGRGFGPEKCWFQQLCEQVRRTRGGTVTIRPRDFRFTGHTAKKFIEFFVRLGCVKRGRYFAKLICPAEVLRKVCEYYIELYRYIF
jgi:hypothetical protein